MMEHDSGDRFAMGGSDAANEEGRRGRGRAPRGSETRREKLRREALARREASLDRSFGAEASVDEASVSASLGALANEPGTFFANFHSIVCDAFGTTLPRFNDDPTTYIPGKLAKRSRRALMERFHTLYTQEVLELAHLPTDRLHMQTKMLGLIWAFAEIVRMDSGKSSLAVLLESYLPGWVDVIPELVPGDEGEAGSEDGRRQRVSAPPRTLRVRRPTFVAFDELSIDGIQTQIRSFAVRVLISELAGKLASLLPRLYAARSERADEVIAHLKRVKRDMIRRAGRSEVSPVQGIQRLIQLIYTPELLQHEKDLRRIHRCFDKFIGAVERAYKSDFYDRDNIQAGDHTSNRRILGELTQLQNQHLALQLYEIVYGGILRYHIDSVVARQAGKSAVRTDKRQLRLLSEAQARIKLWFNTVFVETGDLSERSHEKQYFLDDLVDVLATISLGVYEWTGKDNKGQFVKCVATAYARLDALMKARWVAKQNTAHHFQFRNAIFLYLRQQPELTQGAMRALSALLEGGYKLKAVSNIARRHRPAPLRDTIDEVRTEIERVRKTRLSPRVLQTNMMRIRSELRDNPKLRSDYVSVLRATIAENLGELTKLQAVFQRWKTYDDSYRIFARWRKTALANIQNSIETLERVNQQLEATLGLAQSPDDTSADASEPVLHVNILSPFEPNVRGRLPGRGQQLRGEEPDMPSPLGGKGALVRQNSDLNSSIVGMSRYTPRAQQADNMSFPRSLSPINGGDEVLEAGGAFAATGLQTLDTSSEEDGEASPRRSRRPAVPALELPVRQVVLESVLSSRTPRASTPRGEPAQQGRRTSQSFTQ